LGLGSRSRRRHLKLFHDNPREDHHPVDLFLQESCWVQYILGSIVDHFRFDNLEAAAFLDEEQVPPVAAVSTSRAQRS
jgi:hypothetical protein